MTLWRNLLALMALPGLAAAADPAMMNLVMPDASTVMEINVAKIMASPVGAAMRDAVHQGMAAGLKGEMAKAKPEYQEQIAALSNIDWSQEVRDIVIARGPGKQPGTLIVVQTSMDLARIAALKAFGGDAKEGGATEYEGVSMLVSSKPDGGAIAFLDGSIVVAGTLSDVQSAIHRRSQPTALPAALTAQVDKYGRDDIWLASTETLTMPLAGTPATKSPAGAQVAQFVEKVAGVNGGLRFSPDFDLSADLEARTEKGAGEIAEGLRWLTGMAQSQAKGAGKAGHGLEGVKCQLSGKHILLSLHVPEEQVRAGLQQMRTAQAARPVAAVRPIPAVRTMPAMSPVPAMRQAAVPAEPSSGLPPPPAGTIRVQSSEMGTVLVPVGKQQ